MRIAVVELAAGDAAVDDIADMLVDGGFGRADIGDLLLGEPLRDVGALLEVDGRGLQVVGDAGEQPPGEVVDRLPGRGGGIIVQGVDGEVGGALVDVPQDQRPAGVIVVDSGLVEADRVGHIVHPGAVVSPGGEQLGGDRQQLVAAG